MLKTIITHPQILEALGQSGHFAQVVIADGNFPFKAMGGPNASTVYLNFRPGLLDAEQVLDGLLEMVNIQGAIVMQPPAGIEPDIHLRYREKLGTQVEWKTMERWAFYDQIKSPQTTLLIATGEQRRFANLILTVGVVKLPEESGF
ncbi:transporter [Puniceicoccales bacterium CK1056]|uniref:Transporter n=1 Tax=Oceanipulchritudo coccoides TaxID=2706888 RepID=A0A6B2M6I1_9BACT|nr:RbsD/FucU family protein [Oceanipulchritudo coccoides]NDV63415.1 transporter [Oceanipulchritudo coccoides]